MKLATAYVEITANTEAFRRQLQDASRLAEQSGRDIARSLQIGSPGDRDSADAVQRNSGGPPSLTNDERPSGQRAANGPASAAARTPRGLLFESPRFALESHDREQGERSLLKQQLELERKQVELLQKLLELLREFRHGVPAVLT